MTETVVHFLYPMDGYKYQPPQGRVKRFFMTGSNRRR